jgi:hypothetical protein
MREKLARKIKFDSRGNNSESKLVGASFLAWGNRGWGKTNKRRSFETNNEMLQVCS